MGILADWQIEQRNIVTPFIKDNYKPGVISYGVTSYGYDARLAERIVLVGYTPPERQDLTNHIDPKYFNEELTMELEVEVDESTGSKYVVMPPHSFVLAETVEEFDIPRDVVATCLGKSTYCRCGIILNVSPLEPEWRGKVTIELSNTTPLPAILYINEGIMQVQFHTADAHSYSVYHKGYDIDMGPQNKTPYPCDVSYADKKGKYQDQKGLTFPK